MSARGTASALLVRRIVGAAAMLGANPRVLTESVGLSPEVLEDPNARVPHETLLATWAEAERATGDPTFGIHLAEISRRMPTNALAFAVATCPTFDRALACIGRYVRVVHEAVQLRTETDGDIARVSFTVSHPLGTHPHGVEFALALVVLLGRHHVGPAFVLREASFAHAGPPDPGEHTRVFGVAPRFHRPVSELVFDRALLTVPFQEHDVALHAHLSTHLDQMLAALESSDLLRARVQKLVTEQLRTGAPDVDEAARTLALSARTLQRRLQQEGTSFQEVVNDARRELAMRYLGDASLTITEVAFLLGFAEPSNFHRAFKRWTGKTPAEARKHAIAS